jgi:dihydroflavonol-4-reductase
VDEVFVTGASGFVGLHVVRELLASGYGVRALVRSTVAARELPIGVRPVLGDLRTVGGFARELRGCRYVVHAAALYSFAPADRPAMHQVNVLGTSSVLEAARIAGVERAVVTSSSATISAHHAAQGSAYHASKVAQERAALAARVPTIAVLPTAPVGPGDRRPTPTGRIVLDGMKGRLVAFPPGRINVVAVEDVARGHVLALERGRPRERYVLGGRNLDFLELFTLAAAQGGRRPPRRPLPVRLALAAAAVDELRCRAGAGRNPFIPLEGVRMSLLDMSAGSEAAREELGWQARRTPAEAVAGAARWYRAHGYAA